MKEKTAELPARKKKVLFVITKSNFGGAQRYVYELASRLKDENFETAVALGGSGILKTKLEEAGVPVFPISSAQRDISITKEIRVLWRLFRIMRKYKPDIVHLNSPKIGGLGAVAARTASILNRFFSRKGQRHPISKIIYTNHGWPFKEPRPEWQLVLIRIFSWLTVFLGGTTIVLSQTEKDDVRNWPLIGDRLAIIPNGLKHFTLQSREDSLKRLVGNERAEEWLRDKWTVIGTISELHKNKGLTFAIDGIDKYIQHEGENLGTESARATALANDRRARTAYIIVSDGEERKNIENLIKEKDLEDKVVLTGDVDEARQYLKAFDIFLMSSVKEGLPFAILEAGYAGVPVISTSVGAIPEVIKNLETGLLIHPARPQQIKNALIYLEDNPEIKKDMTVALKKKVEETFNFDTVTEKIKALYLN